MSAAPSLTLRAYDPADESAAIEAWSRATPSSTEHRPAGRSEALWRWQFPGNPDGFRIQLAFDVQGRVVGQVAGFRRRVRVGDETVHWLGLVEMLNDPGVPNRLGRHLPIDGVCAAFLEACGGVAPEGHPILFGFPTRSAFRLAFKRGGGEAVRNQNKLCLVPKELRGDFEHSLAIEEVASFDDAVDDLFQRASPQYGAIAIRDAKHLNWRFGAHPERTYRIAYARRSDGRLVGYAVFHKGWYDGREDGLVADWLVDPSEPAAGHALRRWLAERTEESGARLLTAVLPDTCPEWNAFQHAAFRMQATADFLVGRSFQRPYDIPWVHRNWYYTLGDFDRC